MKILLAIDDSKCSQRAVTSVASRPWPRGSEVRIISVIDPPLEPTPHLWKPDDETLLKLREVYQTHIDAVVRKAEGQIQDGTSGPIKVTAHVVHGSARDEIIDEAERWGADVIVIGSHGRSGFKRLWLGSVSSAVLEQAPCSVEIVKCPEEES